MLTELRSYIAKATNGRDDEEQIFNLTNFDVQEVSNVDAPANEQPYLLIKGALTMSHKALKEILGDGAGEFIAKLEGDAGTGTSKDEGEGDAMPEEGEGDGDGDAAPALRLSETTKQETLQGLGVVIKALITVAKAVDSAEVVAEGGDALPDDLKTVVRSSSQVLGKMLGEAAAPAPEAGKAAATPDNVTKKKVEEFGQTLETLGGVIENLQTALGVKAPTADGGGNTEAAKVDPEVAKALGTITTLLKRQGGAITDLRERVGLSAALPAEGKRVNKSAADDFDGWPLDMNEDRRQAAR